METTKRDVYKRQVLYGYKKYIINWELKQDIIAVSYTHLQYYRLADMKGLLKRTDEWARRRIRAVYWKQWKKIKTRYRMLKALGMEHWLSLIHIFVCNLS